MAKKKQRKVKAKKKPQVVTLKQSEYFASMEFNEVEFNATGETAFDAFTNVAIVIPRSILKTKATLTLRNENLEAKQILFGVQFRRFLTSNVARDIWAKRLAAKLA